MGRYLKRNWETCVPPCNGDFYQTASWLNFYLSRDHIGKRLGVPTMPKAK